MTTKHALPPLGGQTLPSAIATSSASVGLKAAYSEQAFHALENEEANLLHGLNYDDRLELLSLHSMWTDGFLRSVTASLCQLEDRLVNMRSHLLKPARRTVPEIDGLGQAVPVKAKPRSHKRKPKPEFRADLHAAICLSRSCIDFDRYYLGKMVALLSVPDAWTIEHIRRVFVALQVLQGRVALLRGQVEQGRLQPELANLAKAKAAALFPQGFDPDAVAGDAKWMYPHSFY